MTRAMLALAIVAVACSDAQGRSTGRRPRRCRRGSTRGRASRRTSTGAVCDCRWPARSVTATISLTVTHDDEQSEVVENVGARARAPAGACIEARLCCRAVEGLLKLT
jgi:hypothetical protein